MKSRFLKSLCEWVVVIVALVVCILLGGLFQYLGFRGILLAILTLGTAAGTTYLGALLLKKIFKLEE